MVSGGDGGYHYISQLGETFYQGMREIFMYFISILILYYRVGYIKYQQMSYERHYLCRKFVSHEHLYLIQKYQHKLFNH